MDFAGFSASQRANYATDRATGLNIAGADQTAIFPGNEFNSSAARHVVFVDTAVTGYQDLIQSLNPDRAVVLLDSATSAIDQITQTLLGRSGIASIEIVSHGRAGEIQLGADWVSFENLAQYSSQIQSWGQALAADGDILLYGCHVALSQRGQQFLQALSQLTQADIAASTDFTGNAASGGNWQLEAQVGKIEARQSFSADRPTAFVGTLAPELLSRVLEVSDTVGGSLPNAQSVSANGQFIVFSTAADNLLDGNNGTVSDGNGAADVFVYDRLNETIQAISVTPADGSGNRTTGNAAATDPVISADGRYVAFISRATNLLDTVIPAGEVADNVYVYDRVGQTITLASPRVNTGGARGNASSLSISPDGRFVAFVSTASDLSFVPDGNAQADVYFWDRDADQNNPVLPASWSSDFSRTANGPSGKPTVSGPGDDGFYRVAFVSTASNIVAGDTTSQDVFIRTLGGSFDVTRVSQPSGGGQPNNSSDNPVISTKGDRVAFISNATNLVANDNNGAQDIFLWSAGSGGNNTIALISANAAGASATVPGGGIIGGNEQASRNPVISADGRFVAFDSGATDLVAGDTNGVRDVFLRDTQTGTTTLISQTAGGAPGDQASSNPTIGGSAGNLAVGFTSSAENLTPNDGNNNPDIFLRRITDTSSSTTLISQDATQGFSALEGSGRAAVSGDGGTIAFTSRATRLTSDTDANGAEDIFVSTADPLAVQLVTKRADTLPANSGNSASLTSGQRNVVSDDGRFAVFASGASNLVSDDSNGQTIDIFRRDRQNGTIELISRANANGSSGNNNSTGAVISGDGNFVAFNSSASNLVTENLGGQQQAFIWDSTGSDPVQVISRNGTTIGNGVSTVRDISATGRVVFTSTATNLAATDGNGNGDSLFLWDPTTPNTVTPIGAAATDVITDAVISKDGNFVVFASRSALTTGDTNTVSDIFRYTVATGQLTRISQPTTGESNGRSIAPSVSADGSVIAFVSDATNLTANSDANGGSDVFVWRASTGNVELLSVNPSGDSATLAGGGFGRGSFRPVVSADGRFVTFASNGSDLSSSDTNGDPLDIFRRDLTNNTTQLISVQPNGESGNGQSDNPVISGDGRFISFTSTSGNLDSRDSNGTTQDVFLWDSTTGRSRLLSLNNDDSGSGNGISTKPAIDRNGNFVMFETTATNLVVGDFNGSSDVVGTAIRPSVSLDLVDATAVEGSTADTAVYRLVRNDATAALTLQLTIDNSSTVSLTDFSISADNAGVSFTAPQPSPEIIELTLPAGVSTVNLTVTATEDVLAEAAETLKLVLAENTAFTARNLSTESITIGANDTGVTSVNDSGEGSLRQAILNANASAGADIISFNLPGSDSSVRQITLNSALPAITDPITLDATLQAGFAGGNPVVEINGASIGTAANGLTLNGDGNIVRGLRIVGFQGDGIVITGNNNEIGNAANTFHGNVISNNTGNGISIVSGTGNRLSANRIFGNTGLGIDLGNDGPTANDANDADAGANNRQNFPVITIAEPNATGATIQGNLAAAADTTYRVELFRTTGTDARFIGNVSVTTDATGAGTFSTNIDGVSDGQISAIAIDPAGNTSEISPAADIGTPTVTISAPTQASQAEGNSGNTAYTFRISLSQASSQDTTITYSTVDGTATAGEDFTGITDQTVTIPAGQTFVDVTIEATGDETFEPDETFSVALSAVSSNAALDTAGGTTALVTIANDDVQPLPQVSIAPGSASVAEDAGSYSFTISLDRTPDADVTVGYSTANGSAISGADFTAVTGQSVTFIAGTTTLSQTVTVPILNDALREPDESFTVELAANPTNAVLSSTAATATGVITNDGDQAPTIRVTPLNARQQDTITTDFTFSVALSGPSGEPISVDYATADGTAVSTGTEADFTATSGTLTFNPGDPLSQTVTVSVNGDSLDEPLEQFNLSLSNPTNATLDPNQTTAIGEILPPNPIVSVSLVDAAGQPLTAPPTINEGNSGEQNTARFLIQLDRTPTSNVRVQYRTVDGTATTADRDYSSNSGTITIPAGTDRRIIEVGIRGDSTFEPDETFSLELVEATGASLGSANIATVTITNDDAAPIPTLRLTPIGVTTQTETAAATNAFQFQVELLNAPTNATITVDYATVNGSAIAGEDFVAATGTLTFVPGQSLVQTINVTAIDDATLESAESFSLQLSNPTTGTEILNNDATVTISDDEAPPPTPSLSLAPIAPARRNEADAVQSPFQFQVTLSNAPTTAVTVDYTTVNGTAIAGEDFVATAGTLTFTPGGATTQTINVTSINDTIVEPDEAFSLQLSNASTGVNITTNTASATIANDDTPIVDPPAPRFSLSSIGPTSQDEATAAQSPFQFQVSLSAAPTSGNLTVDYTTVNGSAIAGSDFVATAGTLIFTPGGNTTQTISVASIDDAIVESSETFSLQLRNPSAGATIATSTVSANITDNDVATPPPPPPPLPPEKIVGSNGTTDLLWRNRSTGQNAIWRTDQSPVFTQIGLPDTGDGGWKAVATEDFDLDGDGDILWHNQTDGSTAIWIMNGEKIGSVQMLASIAPIWSVQEVADFTGDNFKDVIWRHRSTGAVVLWEMAGTNLARPTELAAATQLDWQLRGSGDFDGDGQRDLLWRNQRTGDNGTWLLANNAIRAIGGLEGQADVNWTIAKVADFNNDNQVDLLWHNQQTGGTGIWLLKGNQVQRIVGIVDVPDVNWQIVDVQDFNRDNNLDIVWRNVVSGANAVWYMQREQLGVGVFLPTVDASLEIAGLADFNDDGTIDIAWNSATTGETFLWRNRGGSNFRSGAFIDAILDQAWQVGATGDFNDDGISDIFWFNSATRDTSIWLMDGGQIASMIAGAQVIGAGWVPQGAADFDRDGDSDIFWYNQSTGDTGIWEIQDGQYVRPIFGLPNVQDRGWQVAGIRDFDLDGTPDVLWRNRRTGLNGIWQMQGFAYANTLGLPSVDLKWEVIGVGQFTGDTSPDIAWRSPVDQSVVIWALDRGVYQADRVTLLPTPGNATWVAAGIRDFNDDGFDDLLWYNESTGEQRLWYITEGRFGASVPFFSLLDTDWRIEGIEDFGTV